MHTLNLFARVALAVAVVTAVGCGGGSNSPSTPSPSMTSAASGADLNPLPPAPPDTRQGLKAGRTDAASATWNVKHTASVMPPTGFSENTNSDIAFTGNYAIQGNYYGLVVWDVSNPSSPTLVKAFPCPASQNDVSVYRNLVFMSAEANNGRIDCATTAFTAADSVSSNRIRGIRIFDITDIRNPKLVASVQTCRGSHTHTVVEDPRDPNNVYVYVSGSAGIRSPSELPRCVRDTPDKNPNSSLMRIEIIKVPVARPQDAAVVSTANIFADLQAPPAHGMAHEDSIANARNVELARGRGAFIARNPVTRQETAVNANTTRPLLDSIVKARGGTGSPTAADSAALRGAIQGIIDRITVPPNPNRPQSVNAQCHDITVYPAIGLAGGACEGHGFLIDIKDPTKPVRLAAAADSNFSYWHSATFNNDGTKILFSDEWGGGGGPKCRATDPKEWGADAIFTVENRQLKFKSYYKLPSVQTSLENCVAHNGSLIPIPGRDVMVQAWYQGGVSVFDWTDASRPREIAYFDRGPVDSTRMQSGGSWSVYWYNGKLVSSEISRGLDVAELTPSAWLTQNEIDAAKTVRYPYFNAQSQPKMEWPPSFPLARAFVDQLERNKCLSASKIASVRADLATAERASGTIRTTTLNQLASSLDAEAKASCDPKRVGLLQKAVNDLTKAIAQ